MRKSFKSIFVRVVALALESNWVFSNRCWVLHDCKSTRVDKCSYSRANNSPPPPPFPTYFQEKQYTGPSLRPRVNKLSLMPHFPFGGRVEPITRARVKSLPARKVTSLVPHFLLDFLKVLRFSFTVPENRKKKFESDL